MRKEAGGVATERAARERGEETNRRQELGGEGNPKGTIREVGLGSRLGEGTDRISRKK